MSSDPKTHDWPQPDERDTPSAMAAEDVLNLGDELALVLGNLDGSLKTPFVDLMARAWEHTPSVSHSMRHLLQLMHGADDGGVEEFVSTALARPQRFHHLFALMGHSRLLGGWIARGVWRTWMAGATLAELSLTPEAMFEALLPKPSEAMPAGLAFLPSAEFVRHFQFAHATIMCEIAASDMIGRDAVDVTARRISDLADASCQACMTYALAQVNAKFGTPVDGEGRTLGLCVFAMGKLGGRELNYSSDIDLILVCSGDGKTVGGPRSIDAPSHATRVAEIMIRALADQGPLGPAYRVDTRLRPDGNAGPLVRTFEATLNYYRQRGATWERQALLKLRPIAGDIELGWRLHEELQPFIHRRYLSIRAINEIKALKHRIEVRTEGRDDTYRDVKTGFGGIRDIEFVVQFLQLVNGGRTPSVRTPNTLEALGKLADAGCLKHEEAEEMAQSYRLLRRIEHGLQLESGQQTHRIDDDPSKLAALAARLGYRDVGSQSAAKQMYLDLARATVKTRGLLLRLFTGLFKAEPEAPSIADLALDPDMDAAKAAPLLVPFGFPDPSQVCALIHRMAAESGAFRRFEPRTRTYLASALPGVLGWASGTRDGMAALAALDRLISCLGAKGVFYELLAERPDVLSEVGRLCTDAGWLLELIERRPGLMDQWLDGLRTGAAFDAARHSEDLANRMGLMPAVEALQWSRDAAFLQIAAADLAGAMSPVGVWGALAGVAEAILVASVRVALGREAGRVGMSAEEAEVVEGRLAVLALGKLGGGTLDYGSDLDIVFVAEPGPEGIGFYERVAQGVVRLLSAESGVYQVDLRLRPQGSKGLTASTLAGFTEHVSVGLAFWERLALARARVVFGAGTHVGKGVAAAVEDACYRMELPSDAAQQTREMRERQEREAGVWSVKRGPGGLADGDFALGLLQMLLGASQKVCRTPSTFGAFDACEGLLTGEVRESLGVLREAMVAQRRWTQREKLKYGSTPGTLPKPPGEAVGGSARMASSSGRVSMVGSAWGPEVAELVEVRRRAREAFEVVLSWAAECGRR